MRGEGGSERQKNCGLKGPCEGQFGKICREAERGGRGKVSGGTRKSRGEVVILGVARELDNPKIGNVLRFFAEQIHDLNLTKALKLLYLLDEASVRRRGGPVTTLQYKIWEQGPVAESIWREISHSEPEVSELTNDEYTLEEYILPVARPNQFSGGKTIEIKPKGHFEEDLFSAKELNLLNEIVSQYGYMTGLYLSELTHQPGSAWHQACQAQRIYFGMGQRTSNHYIDFSKILDDERARETYKEYLENTSYTLSMLSKSM